jgi:hypothetical protein
MDIVGFGPSYTPKVVAEVAHATAVIATLNSRISGSLVLSAWQTRAAWAGYARALQLEGHEVDEIDLFSWGCRVTIPATNRGEYEAFAPWQDMLGLSDPFVWRDALPKAVELPAEAADHPPLVRALEQIRRYARVRGGLDPWLGLPFALRDQDLTGSPLPYLVGGAKAFRLKKTLNEADWLAVLRALAARAERGLERLDHLERLHRKARTAIAESYRPGALPSLLALTLHQPVLSPQAVARLLDLTVTGASRLLERAARTGLLTEITTRRTWRIFMSVDLAVEFGFARVPLGRPRVERPLPSPSRNLAAVFDQFDAEMAAIDELLKAR